MHAYNPSIRRQWQCVQDHVCSVSKYTYTQRKERRKRERTTYMVVHTYDFSSRETEEGGPELQGHLGNHNKFKINLEYMTCCLKGNRYRSCIENV